MLELRNLTTIFPLKRGVVRAVTGVDLILRRGDILGLVGESGCGKSVTMLSILRLVPYPGQIVAGQVVFEGRDLLKLPPGEMRKVRGREIAMIFQDPMSTLNPVFPIGEQIGESLRIHGLVNGRNRHPPWPFNRARQRAERERVLHMLEEVGIPTPAEASRRYPHEYSGGMQQRALIAIALSCGPKILLADEPTTALDVTVQAQIMDLLNRINREHGTSIILVTHDLGLAAEFCHNIAVMYAGRIVEEGPTNDVIEDPKHPYTRGLLDCIPRIRQERRRIKPIPGTVPDLINLPPGCAFRPRCAFAREECLGHDIPLAEIEPGRLVRCILYPVTR
ncbi:MAG TPA: ABC transporter ATP-binding protein [Anaerolineae bacterium]|nr:ABC transporter ATP-binding protein [Anaerolineae bacterium]